MWGADGRRTALFPYCRALELYSRALISGRAGGRHPKKNTPHLARGASRTIRELRRRRAPRATRHALSERAVTNEGITFFERRRYFACTEAREGCSIFGDGPFHTMNTVLGFGKHRGVALKTVARTDPRYIQWLRNLTDASDNGCRTSTRIRIPYVVFKRAPHLREKRSEPDPVWRL